MRKALTLLVCVATLSSQVALAAEPADIGRAVGQPFRDLSLIQDKLAEPLKRAAENPYDLSRAGDCAQIRQEIADLNTALGPDLDEAAEKKTGVTVDSVAADLIGGVVKLPFRGLLRRMSGAQAREEAMRAAVLAGMVRRGFLKGRLSQQVCPPV